jgi:hypothetical protein
MYGIFTYIYPKNGPNVGKYSIHGAYGIEPGPWMKLMRFSILMFIEGIHLKYLE